MSPWIHGLRTSIMATPRSLLRHVNSKLRQTSSTRSESHGRRTGSATSKRPGFHAGASAAIALNNSGPSSGSCMRAHLDIEEVREVGRGIEREVRTTHLSGDTKAVLGGLEKLLRDEVDRSENR